MKFDVFISYPHQNKATADAVCAKLEDAGIRCWIAPRDITPSADWAASIVEAIDACPVLVLIFSAHANRSRQVAREVQQACEKEKPVVPFRIEDVEPESTLAYYVRSVHWLNALTPPVDQYLTELVTVVRRLLAGGATGEKVDEISGAHLADEVRSVAALKAESRSRQNNVDDRKQGPLQIALGEQGPFCDVPKGGPWGLTRRLKIEVRNVDELKTVSGGKVQIMEILPFCGYRGPWVIAENIVLAAGDQSYLPIAQYGEARDKAKYDCADTMIEVCCLGKAPLLQIEAQNILTGRFTANDVPFCEIKCAIFVDTSGHFRIRPADAPNAEVLPIERDVWLYDAICRMYLGRWDTIAVKDGRLDLSANGFQSIHDLVEHVRQLAFDGRFPIWGKGQGYKTLWERAEPVFWQHNQIDYLSFTDGEPRNLRAVPCPASGQVIALRELMTSRAAVESICNDQALTRELPTNDSNSLRILIGTGGPFDKIEANKYGIHHTIYVALTNEGSRRINNCKFYRTYVAFTKEEEKTMLDGPFSLDPKERRYVPIAYFNETKDLPHANHLIGLSMPAAHFGAGFMQPRLPPDRYQVVSFIAQSTDSKDAGLHCQVWVDEQGKLRLEPL